MARRRNPAVWTDTELLSYLERLATPELRAWMQPRKKQIKKLVKQKLKQHGKLAKGVADVRSYSDERLVIFRMGLGRDSLAMLGLLCEGRLIAEGKNLGPADIDAVVFTDPGAEWASTYSLIGRVQQICDDYGLRFLAQRKPAPELQREFIRAARAAGTTTNIPRPWRRVEPKTIEEKCATGWYHNLPAIMATYAMRNAIIAYNDAGCTGNHKIAPNRMLINDLSRERWGIGNSTWGNLVGRELRRPHLVLLGIAANEAHRALAGPGFGPSYEASAYPLVEMGVTKAMEADVLKRWDLDHAHKSGCFMCKYQDESWFWALSVTEPERFQAAVEYERAALEGGRVKDNKQYIFPKGGASKAQQETIDKLLSGELDWSTWKWVGKGDKRKPRAAAQALVTRGWVAEDGTVLVPKPPTPRLADVVQEWRRLNPNVTVEQVMRKDYKRNDTVDGQAIPKTQRAALADANTGKVDGKADGVDISLGRLK